MYVHKHQPGVQCELGPEANIGKVSSVASRMWKSLPQDRRMVESYLHNRSQRVTTLGATSSPLPVSPGVPQGSILGPMLFLLYVNSLPDAVRSSQIAAFADDTKVFKEITSKRDAEQLQEDLSDLIT